MKSFRACLGPILLALVLGACTLTGQESEPVYDTRYVYFVYSCSGGFVRISAYHHEYEYTLTTNRLRLYGSHGQVLAEFLDPGGHQRTNPNARPPGADRPKKGTNLGEEYSGAHRARGRTRIKPGRHNRDS